MNKIEKFLTREFLPRRGDLREPDGRLLYLYECRESEFWILVDLLRESGAPKGHDFDEYRRRWSKRRKEFRGLGQHEWFNNQFTTDLDWTVRGFVLYASEFWHLYEQREWRYKSFPDDRPFKKLTWMQFLSLVDWTELYRGREMIVGYTKIRHTQYRVAHGSKRIAEAIRMNDDDGEDKNKDENDETRVTRRARHYPSLYLPMLAAWNWWKVNPVSLPSSIRYLDTFAYQGGAGNRIDEMFRRMLES